MSMLPPLPIPGLFRQLLANQEDIPKTIRPAPVLSNPLLRALASSDGPVSSALEELVSCLSRGENPAQAYAQLCALVRP